MKSQSVTVLLKCRICSSSDFYDFLDLGEIPIPNGFIAKDALKQKEKKYPLIVSLCNNCYLVQLKYIVHPEIMFKNYLYIPSSSKTRINHFRDLASYIQRKAKLREKSLVVDIGSNDGSLLKCFKNLGVQVLGVDPAENLVKVAELNGVPTMHGYFSPQIARKIIKKYKKASAILATNVVAHIDDLHNFLAGIDILLDTEGVFVCQFPYLRDLIEKNQFDTIYHEHLSYFALKPLMHLAKTTNLEIFDIERNDLDGGSIRVFWKKRKNKSIAVNKEQIEKLLIEEETVGLYKKKTYKAFAQRIRKLKVLIKRALVKIKKDKNAIVGYGAAAKGNILLNYFNIGPKVLDYIVDSTSYKQGLYTPGTHVPIYEEERIYQTKPEYILILAWNFKEEIIEKNRNYKKNGGKLIVVIPGLEII